MSNAELSPIKVKLTRAWSDLAPKLVAFLTGGTAVTIIVGALHVYADVVVDPALAGVFVTFAGGLLGYFVKDTTTVDAADIDFIE